MKQLTYKVKQETYDEWIYGRTCISCAIFKPDTFCFALGWSNFKGIEKKKEISFYLVHRLSEKNPDGKPQDIGIKFPHDSTRYLAANPTNPEIIMAASGLNILYHTEQGGKTENILDRKDIKVTTSVKYIGRHFFVTGLGRAALRRDGVDKWTLLSREIKPDREIELDCGFEDIDGFDDSDIYAVGGDGDAWHYDGKNWSQIDVPTNASFESVCCASDGNVYIGGFDHMILRGRGDRWEIINKDETGRRYKQIIDYEGRMLAVDEWGAAIYEITPDGVIQMDTGDFFLAHGSCLCMAVNYGMLLVAGIESAAVFDGKNWHSLFSRAQGVDDETFIKMMIHKSGEMLDAIGDTLKDVD